MKPQLTSDIDEREEDDKVTSQARDAKSILDLCLAKGMPHRMLNWHYRSKHQSLIAVDCVRQVLQRLWARRLGGAGFFGERGDHVVLAPPFIVTAADIEIIVDRFAAALEGTMAALPQAA